MLKSTINTNFYLLFLILVGWFSNDKASQKDDWKAV